MSPSEIKLLLTDLNDGLSPTEDELTWVVAAARQTPTADSDDEGGRQEEGFEAARPSLIPSLCTQFTRAGIEWRR